MLTLKTSLLPQVPLSVVFAQKWGYKSLWTAQVPALVGCSSLFYNWGSWGQGIVVSKCFVCCHNELLGDSETHFWHVRIKFHSSVNGLHCIHLCCAQAPPRCCLGRESEKQKDKHHAVGTTAWAATQGASIHQGPLWAQWANGTSSPNFLYRGPLSDPFHQGQQNPSRSRKRAYTE